MRLPSVRRLERKGRGAREGEKKACRMHDREGWIGMGSANGPDGRGRGQTADGGQANRAEGLVIFVERKMIYSLYECSTNQRA